VSHDDQTLGASIEDFMQGLEDFTEIVPEATSETCLLVNWARKGVGFGQLSFWERDGVLWCDNEAMSRTFCKGVLEELLANVPEDDWPPLVRRFDGASNRFDALLDACTPHHPGPDWPAPKEKT